MELTLNNSGEDAYWVQLSLSFPWGLSFRKVEMLKVSEKAGLPTCPARLCSFRSPLGASASPDSLHTRAAAGTQRSLGHMWVRNLIATLNFMT